MWAAVEGEIAAKAGDYSPADLQSWATALVETLDQDGAQPEDRPPPVVNELLLTRHRDGSGGKIKGRIDDALMYDAIATAVDAKATPRTAEDQRSVGQRQAEALADICGYVLDHGDVPDCGGQRPHVNVIVTLEELENRARTALLNFGGALSPEALRMLCCDARVVPIVMNGKGQPLDVGRATRVIPDGLRRAVAARDRGCARCGRPPSWCEIHHVLPWTELGETTLGNCVMLCRSCHRLVHFGGWEVRMVEGTPEFLPPMWLDCRRKPRRRPPHLLKVS